MLRRRVKKTMSGKFYELRCIQVKVNGFDIESCVVVVW